MQRRVGTKKKTNPSKMNVRLSNSPLKATVDEEDLFAVLKHKWMLDSRGYVRRTDHRKAGITTYLHGLIGHLHKKTWKEIHHVNEDKLNNKKSNLRFLSKGEHTITRGPKSNNTSGYVGVYYNSNNRNWDARIVKDGIKHWMCGFASPVLAAQARDKKAKELYGEIAYQNIK